MYYLIDNDVDNRCNTVDEVLEWCVSRDYYIEDEEGFDSYLDDDGPVEICGYEYRPSTILQEMGDYHQALCDWAADQVENAYANYSYDLIHLNAGDWTDVCGYEVYAYEEEPVPEEEVPEEEAVEMIETQVEYMTKQELSTSNENKQLEDDFMSVFQMLK